MKRQVLMLVILCTTQMAFAQKYMTRTGKISFFSSTPVEKIEAFNNETACILDSKSGDILFQASIKSFKFEKELMQEHFNEDFMQSDKYPKSDFKGKVTNISSINFSKDGSYPATVAGKLTIHGVTHDVSVPGTIVVKGNDITTNAKFQVKLADYNIKVPSMMTSKVAEKMEITVNSILSQVNK